MPKLRSLPVLALLASFACRAEPPSPPEPEESEQAVQTLRPAVDAQAMMASIEWLASDERNGRFTLETKQIEAAASWIAARYEALGLEPVAGAAGLRVPYALRTGATAGPDQHLVIESRKGKRIEVPNADFTPRVESSTGSAAGELVFVGYGLQWTRPPEQVEQAEPAADAKAPAPGALVNSYDELSGVELEGKIALVLAEAPNSPNPIALYGAIQRLAEDFEVEAAPLREADELAKLEAMHLEARKTLVDYAASIVDIEDLGDAYWKVEDPKARLDIMQLASVFAARTGGRPQIDMNEASLATKLDALVEAGVAGVIVVQGPRSFVGSEARKADALTPLATDQGPPQTAKLSVLPSPSSIPVVQMRWKRADKLFSIGGKKLSQLQAALDGDYRPRSQALGVEVELQADVQTTELEVPNVLAQLRGESDEVIMLGAHFDHIGDDVLGQCRAIVRRDDHDKICNGADDNASGTAMLLELARAYKDAGITPKRTIVFAHFSGEELGLLGSHAVMEQAPFDQSRVAAMVNLDMVGRLGPRGLAVGGIGSSKDWMPLLDELGNYGMQVLYEGSTTTRSDHAHWFRKQIPVLFFFTGMHGDYHRAGDEIDTINVEGLATIGQFVSDLIWELAGGRAIAWTDPLEGDGIGRGLPGSDPSTVIKRVGEDGLPLERE